MSSVRSIVNLRTHLSRLGCSLSTASPSRRGLATAKVPSETSPQTLLQDKKHGFGFLRSNPRPAKPRKLGVTEIRGPYYSAYGKRHLQDVLETMSHHIDGLKFAGGSFSLLPERALVEMIELAHEYDVYVSTGGFIEHVLTHADVLNVVDKYLKKFSMSLSYPPAFSLFPPDDWLRLIDKVHNNGLIAKPELGIQFGAGGDTSAAELEATGQSDPFRVVSLGKNFLDAGVERLMIESEGITENVKTWRTDAIQEILKDLPMERVMFEAADPKVFNWYIREFGADVNLFVDHSQIVQLSCLRSGIWGMADTFGKVVSYRQ
ncbi:sulfonate biosynthesis enzyme [Pisolithus croceorrhizus]|nr:sulfonate biosynthesis enzyme [Pisolithus croceorrhizus]